MAQETTKHFETLNVRGMMRLLQFAMQGIGRELKQLQEELLLEERFGNDAVSYLPAYNPDREEHDRLGKKMRRYEDLLKFGKNVQAMLTHVQEVDMNAAADMFAQYWKQQEEEIKNKRKKKS